jgi:hypothetical protein
MARAEAVKEKRLRSSVLNFRPHAHQSGFIPSDRKVGCVFFRLSNRGRKARSVPN